MAKHMSKKISMKGKLALQSAMEYLMTYGWAILVIAVVLVALFELGLFNQYTFAPKAIPGSCEVIRNYQGAALEGTCNNEIPQSVAQFNGNNAAVTVAQGPALQLSQYNTGLSVSAWFYASTTSSWSEVLGTSFCGIGLWPSTGDIRFTDNCGDTYQLNYTLFPYTWYNVIATVTSGSVPYETYYVNGKLVGQGAAPAWHSGLSSRMCIGWDCNTNSHFNGYIANVQIYNTTLTSGQANVLYIDGIGAAPTDLQNLVGWWPLNGNDKDYSGNAGNAQGNGNMSYSGSWYYSGYVSP